MNQPLAPQAERRPVTVHLHGVELVDEYAWLRDRNDPAVAAHLEAENAYTDAMTAHTKALQDTLFAEIRSRVQETDETVPARRGEWWYLTRTYEGRQYPVYCRRKGAPDGPEDVVLDHNELAADHEFCALGIYDVSPDGNLVAYALDTDGSEQYTLRWRDLRTGEDRADVIEGAYYGSAWAADNTTFFYTRPDAAMRPYQVWRHTLGTDAATDVMVFEEPDDRFFLSLGTTKSHAYVLIALHSHTTTETWVLAADDAGGEFRVIRPRVPDVEYMVEHAGDRFVIVTNAGGAQNFKVVSAPVAGPERWETLVEHRPDVRVDELDVFSTHLVLRERTGGSIRLAIRSLDGSEVRDVEPPDAAGTPSLGANYEVDEPSLRFHYTSLATPPTVFDENLATGERITRKVEPVPGYDASRYETHRLWATAPDGARVPISLVARRGMTLDGSNPTLLYGYGSYESCVDPAFNAARVSLLERGFAFAIAHVRGGGEMGRPWYEGGKLGEKRNTFTDFIACAEHLVAEGWTAPERLVIRGRSAGGLLMGAVTNLRPDLFRAVVAEVPFVDVINTMLDETLPLTVPEWEEWGNPREPEAFAYMLTYSPYENVETKDYPRILATGGFNDPRVAFWEPAKWVARLRDRKTDDNIVLLQTEMGAGHMGPTGRYNAWHKEAFALAFMLDAVGLA